MERQTTDPIKNHDSTAELKAVVEARRELGPELEDQLLTAFLGRIQQQVDARVREDLARNAPAKKISHGLDGGQMVGLATGTFALATPLVVLAGVFGGVGGIIAVMFAVVLVNLMYLADRWK